jgi:exodeoxyribonuclease V alpha subunit
LTNPDLRPDECLAAAFGLRAVRWAYEQGASVTAATVVGRAAQAVSQATSDGHTCLGLGELVESLAGQGSSPGEVPLLDAATLRMLLMESSLVGTPQAPGEYPLILDDHDRLYLHRYFDYERRLAHGVAARSSGRTGAAGGADAGAGADADAGADAAAGSDAVDAVAPHVLTLLNRLFADNAPAAGTPDWQKIAVITALLGRLTIVSGGPGTGKTTAVVNLLACLLEDDPACRIALTAPTGKAAARITEALRQRSGHLPDHLRSKLPAESSTIHRLLGGLPSGDFRHHAANQLPIDVLIVDEASMLDLALAVHLFEAVPSSARIILLGDKDQLAAVESGAVFSELSAKPVFRPGRIETLARLCGVAPQVIQMPGTDDHTGLEDCVIWLRRNYRFTEDSSIGLLAAEINRGNTAGVLARLHDTRDPGLVWRSDAAAVPSQESVRTLLERYSSYIEAVRHAADPEAITASFGHFRVLCAVREGPWGVKAINDLVSIHFRRTLQHPLDPGLRSEWYPGRPVMVLRNDYVLKLFNGDIGIVLPDARGTLKVYFPDEARGLRAIAPVRLPEHETAFAMTVHKAQGSEFDEVAIVLPSEVNRVLSRELLYTAVTRARERVVVVSNVDSLVAALESPARRASGFAG